MHRVWWAVIALTFALSACSTPDTQQATSTPSPQATTPTPSESSVAPEVVWREAIDTTAQADASMVEVQLITNVEGFERITSGIGYVELGRGFGDIRWTDDLGESREVISPSGHFLEIDATWFEVATGRELPTTVAFDPLAGLATATNVVLTGSDQVQGEPAIRLEADLDPSLGVDMMGFSDEERTVFAGETDGSLVATMWVDTEGRIVRLVREYVASSVDGDPISATSLFLLSGAGEFRPIDVPETADAIPAPV